MNKLTNAQLFTLTQLERVINNTMGTDDKTQGLCYYASLGGLGVNLYTIFREWKHYSGYYHYPVPSPDGAMEAYRSTINKYDRRTEYGKLRVDLAKYLHTTFCKMWNVNNKLEG